MVVSFFLLAILSSVLIALPVKLLMQRYGIVHRAHNRLAGVGKREVAYGGGIVIGLVILLLGGAAYTQGYIGASVIPSQAIGVAVSIIVLLIGGVIDDKWNIGPGWQIVFPMLAALITVESGVRFFSFSIPSGSFSLTDMVESQTISTLLVDVLVFAWLMIMMMTTKVLDGLDGLVTGITTIAAVCLFVVSLQAQWFDPGAQLMAMIVAGACLGFLVWNKYPATMFLGQGGSLIAGYLIAVLAILSEAKIMISVLVMGVPLLDVLRVMIIRKARGKSILTGDNEHLHYRLLDSGLSHKQTVYLLYAIALLCGMTALFLQNQQQLMAFAVLFVLMLLVALWFERQRTS